MSERVRVREIDDDGGTAVTAYRASGYRSVVPWRRAQMVLLPGRQWAAVSGKHKDPDREPWRRPRATYIRAEGVRHLLAAYELGEDKLFGHVKPRKTRTRFLEFCRYLRSRYPATARIAIVCDNFSPHLSTAKDSRVGDWAAANNVEIAYTPASCSWLNRIPVHRAATTPTTNGSGASSPGPTWPDAAASRA
jgi:hypothetical protein